MLKFDVCSFIWVKCFLVNIDKSMFKTLTPSYFRASVVSPSANLKPFYCFFYQTPLFPHHIVWPQYPTFFKTLFTSCSRI